LAGRTHIIFLIFGFVIYLALRIKRKYGIFKSTFAAFLIGVFLIIVAFLFPANREKFKEAFNYGNEYGVDKKWGDKQIRFLIWDCALKLVRANILFGVGTGDTQDELQSCYIRNDYYTLTFFENTKFNAHNQFLEIFIEFGFWGLAVFVINLYCSTIFAVKNKEWLYFVFIILFAVSCLTESLLERRNGIVFFAFFNSFLLLYNQKTLITDSKLNL
jgi:O-antigen ligase